LLPRVPREGADHRAAVEVQRAESQLDLARPRMRVALGIPARASSSVASVSCETIASFCAGLIARHTSVSRRKGRKGTVLQVTWPRTKGTGLAEVCPPSLWPVLVEDRPLSPADVTRGVSLCVVSPGPTLFLARLMQWASWLQDWVRPALEKKGARIKEEWRAKGKAGCAHSY